MRELETSLPDSHPTWDRSRTVGFFSEDDVHLWYSSLDLLESSLEHFHATLDANEREKAKRFCSDRERARFIVSRGLLRKILGHYVGVLPSELQFCSGLQGKPSLTEKFGGDKIQFNLAHSGGYAIYAVTLDRRIGVDLELVSPFSGLEQFADRFFSEREKTVLHGLTKHEKLEAFFKMWTAKEAYLKACGKGLSHRLDTTELSLPYFQNSLTIHGEMGEGPWWSLTQLQPAPGFTAAVVVEGCEKHSVNLSRSEVNWQYA